MPRRHAIVLSVLLLSVLLSPLRRQLYIGDETKYAQVVRELRGGAVVVPTLEGAPFTHKPPLHFWIIGLLTVPFGLYSLWPFVIPSIVAFACLLWLMQKMEGPLAAFVCGSALMVWGSAQTARMDVGFTALVALAVWMIMRFFDGEPRAIVHAGVATGIAVLVKGPMALVIVPLFFAFEALRHRGAPKGRYLVAIGAALVIPLLWLVPAIAIAGESFWREIFFKQTVGRALGAWVHKSPPWFYLVRSPLTMLPWFFVAVVAIIAAYKRNDERAKSAVSWILAVIVPYSIISSKLDIYMMAMIPPVAIVVSRLAAADDLWSRLGKQANGFMIALFAIAGVAGLALQPQHIADPQGALIALPKVRWLFIVLVVTALAAFIANIRGALSTSIIATGLVPVIAFAYAAIALVPMANELASPAPLVRVLERQRVPATEIALHASPHLWTRGMNPALAAVHYVDPEHLKTWRPTLIVTRRKDESAIADDLRGYRKVDELRMIGKWFDVYRR